MINLSFLRSFSVFALLLLGTVGYSQSIFQNPLTGVDFSGNNPHTTGQIFDPNILVSGIGRGAGANAATGVDLYNADGFNTGIFDPTDYFTFTIQPNTGVTINFTSFVYHAQVGMNGPTSFAFRSSVDNFTANIGTPTITGATISLIAPAFQGITAPITFRLYAWNAATADGTFGIEDFDFIAAGPLPIELTAFRAEAIDARTAKLTFSTATERNNHYFAVERSQDGARYETIGQVQGAGNSSVQQDYSYLDQHPAKGLNFYRLQQVDFDGQFAYSPVVTLTFGQSGVLHLAPQPVVDQMRVQLEQPVAQDSPWEVYDFAGRLLQSGILEAESAEFRIPTTSLTEGSYVLRLLNGATVLTQQFQKK